MASRSRIPRRKITRNVACHALRASLLAAGQAKDFRLYNLPESTKENVHMTLAFVCIGSNMGDAKAHLQAAHKALDSIPGVFVAQVSSYYETEPQGRKDQPWFLNQVLRLECSEEVTALNLLDAMLEKEIELGRVRDTNDRFGPRVIDMDLLLFGQEIHNANAHLIVPHPRMHERAFVLVPLAELAPEQIVPGLGTVENLLKRLDYRLEGSAIFQ